MSDPEPDGPGWRRLSRRELIALDGLAAVFYLALFLLVPAEGSVPVPVWLMLVATAAIGLPVTVRRCWPVPVFAVVFAVSVVELALGVIRDPFLGAAYALYAVACTERRRRREPSVAMGVVALISLVGAAVVGGMTESVTGAGYLVPAVVALAGAWTIGRAVQARRAYGAWSAVRLAEQAVVSERLRIARELHDVVSHTLSLIGIKAGVANHVADARPQEARDALRVIEQTSRDALLEMRRLLGVLRAEQTADELEPLPELSGLPELADRAAVAGVSVELRVSGVDGLAPGVALSVYRIVQEAVTNVIKHAAPARCRVVVDGGPEEVRIEVTDDGNAAPGSTAGHGLVGMRERALLLGGSFAAGPGRGGGFAVSVRLPCRPSMEDR